MTNSYPQYSLGRSMALLFVLICLASCTSGGPPREDESSRDSISYLKHKEKDKDFNTVWAKNFDPSYESGNLPISFVSPLIHHDLLFIGDQKGYFYAYALKDGREIWRAGHKGPYNGKGVIYRDQIIYGTNAGRIYSRDFLTGKKKYEIDLGAAADAPPVVYNGRIFFHLRDHNLYALDVETGKILWSYKRSVSQLTTIHGSSHPVVKDNRLYVGFADGSIAALNIEDGGLIWERSLTNKTKFTDVTVGPVLFEDVLYSAAADGPLTSIQKSSGLVLQYYSEAPTRGPLFDQGKLVFGTIDGQLVKMDKFGKIDKKLKLGDGRITSITKWKNKYIVGTTWGMIYSINKDEMKVKDSFSLGRKISSVFGDVITKGDYLAVYTARNRLYVFKK